MNNRGLVLIAVGVLLLFMHFYLLGGFILLLGAYDYIK